jgi:DNA-directed RNA polymerase subunit N (RpoN/RPB10)
MLYPRCPTCGKILANLEIDYNEAKNKICNNSSLNKEQQNAEKEKLVNSLGLERYCCKTRVLKYLNLIDFIK